MHKFLHILTKSNTHYQNLTHTIEILHILSKSKTYDTCAWTPNKKKEEKSRQGWAKLILEQEGNSMEAEYGADDEQLLKPFTGTGGSREPPVPNCPLARQI